VGADLRSTPGSTLVTPRPGTSVAAGNLSFLGSRFEVRTAHASLRGHDSPTLPDTTVRVGWSHGVATAWAANPAPSQHVLRALGRGPSPDKALCCGRRPSIPRCVPRAFAHRDLVASARSCIPESPASPANRGRIQRDRLAPAARAFPDGRWSERLFPSLPLAARWPHFPGVCTPGMDYSESTRSRVSSDSPNVALAQRCALLPATVGSLAVRLLTMAHRASRIS
jgi:hypothetical protein